MGMTGDTKALELAALLPRGAIWRGALRVPILGGLLRALGDLGADADNAIAELRNEADPRTTSQLLEPWEHSVGLPDTCLPGGGSTQQRRNAVVARLNALGGADAAYFRDVATSIGVPDVVVTNIGVKRWLVSAPTVPRVDCTCNDTCNDALQVYGGEQLVCLINELKPADTVADFHFGP